MAYLAALSAFYSIHTKSLFNLITAYRFLSVIASLLSTETT
jgi:hypothetical protein